MPYKCCHMVQEQCVKQVPYTICKPVHYTKTVQCCHKEPKQVAYTVTRCVPESGVQASAGASVLPSPLLLRLHEDGSVVRMWLRWLTPQVKTGEVEARGSQTPMGRAPSKASSARLS